MNKLKTIFTISALTAVFILPGIALAQGSPAAAPQTQSGLMNRLESVGQQSGFETGGAASVPTIIGTVISVTLSFLGAIFLGLMIYAGYKWMTAAGNEQDIEKAKSTIKQAIIGLIVVLSSWSIWTFIFKAFILGS